MRILISQPVRRLALDFSLLRKLPDFVKNPIGALKKFLIDSFKKGEFTLQDAIGVVNKNVKTADISLKPIVLAALVLLGSIQGSKVVGQWLEDNLTEMIAPEKAHQQEVNKVINEK